MMKKQSAILLFLLLATFLAAIGVSYAGGQAVSTRTIIDMNGKTVMIPAKVNRVAVGGAINQMVLMLGGVDKIVATSTVVQSNPMFVKIYPKIKNVAAPFVITDANIEELLKTKPDVVFGGNAKMESLGLPVIGLSLRNPAEIERAVMLIGKILGPMEEKKALQFCRYYKSNMNWVSQRTKSLPPDKRVKVFYAGNKGTYTDGKDSITTSWIEMAGGINVAAAAGIGGLGREVSMEELVTWNPDVIIMTDPALKNKILQDYQWKKLNAVKNNRVYVNPKGVYLWSVRSGEEALQVLWAAKVIQPALFGDLNLNEAVHEFYKTYYNYALSQAELEEILAGDSI
jgi:iron complex transport system substrate-binding protein